MNNRLVFTHLLKLCLSKNINLQLQIHFLKWCKFLKKIIFHSWNFSRDYIFKIIFTNFYTLKINDLNIRKQLKIDLSLNYFQ